MTSPSLTKQEIAAHAAREAAAARRNKIAAAMPHLEAASDKQRDYADDLRLDIVEYAADTMRDMFDRARRHYAARRDVIDAIAAATDEILDLVIDIAGQHTTARHWIDESKSSIAGASVTITSVARKSPRLAEIAAKVQAVAASK
jgi:hypothetical protein